MIHAQSPYRIFVRSVLLVLITVMASGSGTANALLNIPLAAIGAKDEPNPDVKTEMERPLQFYRDREIQIRELKLALEANLDKLTPETTDPIFKQKLDILKKIEISLGQYIDLKSKSEVEANTPDKSAEEIEVKSVRDLLKADSLVSIRAFDQIKRDLGLLQKSKSIATREMEDVRTGIEIGQKEMEVLGKEKRLLDDLLTRTPDESSRIDLLNLQIELQEVNLLLLVAKLDESKTGIQILTSQITQVEQSLGLIRTKIKFTKEELDEILAGITAEEMTISDSLQLIKSDQEALDKKWVLQQGRNDNPAEKSRIRTERDLLRKRIEFYGLYQAILLDLRKTWESRYRYINEDSSRDFLNSWNTDLKKLNKEAQSSYQLILKSLLTQHKILTVQRDRLKSDEIKSSPEDKQNLKREIKDLKEFTNFANDMIINVEKSTELYAMIKSEYMGTLREFDWDEFVDEGLEIMKAVWNYEVMALDDKPLTVKKIIIAILLLVVGFFMAKRFSNLLRKKVYNRFVQTESARSALQTISFYLLLFMFTMFALKTANIPLTMFTLLGGAFAIGIGFGSQNLINNFISGLILLAERPINVGDMIEVDGTYGEVKRIGARSTNVRTGTNIDIMVPNSAFLEKNVINWTLTDDTFRSSISVGVAYGSPVRLVEKLLNQALEENFGVLKTKPFQVLFANFGDNSLIFELHFWIKMRMQNDRRAIESELRFRIDELFRENGVVIAYPQRDIHIDSTKPLEVKMV